MASLRHPLASTIAVLTVASVGAACGQITNGTTNDASGGSMSSGAASSDDQAGSGGQHTGGSGGGCVDSWSAGGVTFDGPSCPSGGAPGQCVFQVGEVQPCPDICTALLQAQCEEPSPHELSSIEYCSLALQTVRVSWSDESGGLSCYYRQGNWVGTYQYAHTPAFCNGTSTEIQYGDLLPDCAAAEFQECAGASDGSDGETGEGGAPPDVPRAGCYSDFSGTCGPCCPSPTPDCSDKPNGYPGYSCFSGYCSCSCFGGEWSCGC